MYLTVYYLLCSKRIRQQKVKFSDLVGAEIQNSMNQEMIKKFQKAQRKYLKKGRGELTWEAFLDKEERDCDRVERLRKFYYLLPPAATVVGVIVTLAMEGFESTADFVIFVVIMLGVEYLILLSLWKIVKSGEIQRRAWVQEKKEEISAST